jgi:hypothetical protein
MFAVMIMCAVSSMADTDLPEGYLSEQESQAILDKTLVITLDPDLSGLGENERAVVGKLIEVGQIFQKLHEHMRHHQALEAWEKLVALDESLGSPAATQNLKHMYYQFKGPIARMLDNKSRAFLPVDEKERGRNVYPWGVEKEDVEAFLDKYPESRPRILGVRTVVRRAERPLVEADLATLDEYPALDALHPGFRERLEGLRDDPGDREFYACPYSVAFAGPIFEAYKLINEAAGLIESDDPEFAAYLRNRGRDLLSNDYESGDASWVTGRFGNLNAEIGSYETYDDQLFGVKSFFACNVLLRDAEQSDALRDAIRGLQDFENSLPYEPAGWSGQGDKKKIREDIPVGVYNIVADFGQSRGTNTATILPNESSHARKYGRTILLRSNIMRNPELFGLRLAAYQSVVARKYQNDLILDGGFYRTLWHEIGHYLGVDRTADGRELDEALEESSSILEELKADLVSLFLVDALLESGYYDEQTAKGHYADGVRRVLLRNKPGRTQTYRVMQNMQFNYYVDSGLFQYHEKNNRLIIHYDKYHDTVASMLARVLELQQQGDKAAADAFIDEYFRWEDDLHVRLGEAMKATETYRYARVRYAALDR